MTDLKNGDIWPMSVEWSEPTDIVITDPCYFVGGDDDGRWDAMLDAMAKATPTRARVSPDRSPDAPVLGKLIEDGAKADYADDEAMRQLGCRFGLYAAMTRNPLDDTAPVIYAPMRQDAWAEFGISKCLCGNTVYGDWTCRVWDVDRHAWLGGFCADAGLYIVCALSEATEHFQQKLEKHPHIATVIRDFKGVVACNAHARCMYIDGKWHDDFYISLEGMGSVNFETIRTGV